MISMENRDMVQRNHEASIRSLQNKGYFCPPQYNATHSEGIPEFHGDTYAQSGVNAVDQDSLSSEHIEPSDESPQRPLYYHDFCRWASAPPCHLIAFQGLFIPVPMNYRVQRAPVNMMAQTYPHDNQLQDFQYFVVIDFEATCDKERVPNPQEIIEFPSVIVSSMTGQLEACFQTYVRPTCNQKLSDFCKDLTGIQQTQVDTGVTLSEALLRHDKWLENKGIKNANFAVVTWSDWDCRVMLESECRYKQIRKPPYFNRWINLKVPFQEVYGGGRCNLKEAVERSGLTWEGRAHCGLDDAKNTARLLALLMQKGFKFSITNSLTNQPNNNNLAWKPTPVKAHFWPQAQRPCIHVCYCGVKSSKGMIRKPGPTQGSVFFGCGNWTAARGARCQYFEWASVTS